MLISSPFCLPSSVNYHAAFWIQLMSACIIIEVGITEVFGFVCLFIFSYKPSQFIYAVYPAF